MKLVNKMLKVLNENYKFEHKYKLKLFKKYKKYKAQKKKDN